MKINLLKELNSIPECLITKQDYEKLIKCFRVKDFDIVEDLVGRIFFVKIKLRNYKWYQFLRKKRFINAINLIQRIKPSGVRIRFFINNEEIWHY